MELPRPLPRRLLQAVLVGHILWPLELWRDVVYLDFLGRRVLPRDRDGDALKTGAVGEQPRRLRNARWKHQLGDDLSEGNSPGYFWLALSALPLVRERGAREIHVYMPAWYYEISVLDGGLNCSD